MLFLTQKTLALQLLVRYSLVMPCIIYKTLKRVGVLEKKIENCVAFTLKKINKSKKEISVHIVGENKIRSLNFLFRGLDRPTDVLSFSVGDGEKFFLSDDLGDIFICLPYIKKQAKENEVTLEEEFFRMLIHGILHLCGHDHEDKKEAEAMFSRQERILSNFFS